MPVKTASAGHLKLKHDRPRILTLLEIQVRKIYIDKGELREIVRQTGLH
jgi:hypothetical protein